MSRSDIIAEIRLERKRQLDKWGNQNNRTHAEWGIILAEEFGEALQLANELHFRRDDHLADDRPATVAAHLQYLREELVQTAAVCVAWLEALESNQPTQDG